MGIRNYLSTIILSISIFIGEVHKFWEGNKCGLEVQNWIVKAYKPMTVQWNIKYASGQLLPVMYFVAMILYRNNKINLTTAITFVWFSIIDCIMYFYNYKTYGYGGVYFWLIIIWIIVYNWKLEPPFWKHIKHWGRK